MTFKIKDAVIGVQEIATTSATQNHPLGARVKAVDPTYGEGEFIYLEGVANTAIGSFVTILEEDFSTALLAANAIGQVGIAMSANVADQYGWYQISGHAVGLAATGYADNALVYATATAGTVDDAVVAGDRVKKARSCSALDSPSTGFAEFEINYPFMDDATAA